MLTRRAFAGAVAAGAAGCAEELPKLLLVAISKGAALPERITAGSVQFSRAYAACPEARAREQSLLTGRFPHSRQATPLIQIVRAETPGSATLFIPEAAGDAPSDSSSRLRLALRHPRLPGGRSVDFPVSTVDIAPTLYGLRGWPQPAGVHGRDLSALLVTGHGERPESVYAEGGLNTADEWRMVVRGVDKIVVRPNLDVLQLFNLAEDPQEERNLAHEIGYQLRVDELRAIVRDWMKRTGDGQDPSGLRRR